MDHHGTWNPLACFDGADHWLQHETLPALYFSRTLDPQERRVWLPGAVRHLTLDGASGELWTFSESS